MRGNEKPAAGRLHLALILVLVPSHAEWPASWTCGGGQRVVPTEPEAVGAQEIGQVSFIERSSCRTPMGELFVKGQRRLLHVEPTSPTLAAFFTRNTL